MQEATRVTAAEVASPIFRDRTAPLPAIGGTFRERGRAWGRIVALVGSTLAISTLYAGGLVACFGRPRVALRWRERCVREWARRTARLIGMHITVEGRPPGEPVLLVANHLSYIDVVALWSMTPAVFVAKSEVAGWPLVGPVGRLIGTVFVDRKRHRDLPRVVGAMREALARGESVILFPEGTSSPGSSVLEFKSSLFASAVRAGRPVACASVAYETSDGGVPAGDAVCWWGDMDFAPHVYALLQRPGFSARVRFAEGCFTGHDRKRIARAARASVANVFEPTTGSGR